MPSGAPGRLAQGENTIGSSGVKALHVGKNFWRTGTGKAISPVLQGNGGGGKKNGHRGDGSYAKKGDFKVAVKREGCHLPGEGCAGSRIKNKPGKKRVKTAGAASSPGGGGRSLRELKSNRIVH